MLLLVVDAELYSFFSSTFSWNGNTDMWKIGYVHCIYKISASVKIIVEVEKDLSCIVQFMVTL